MGYVQVWSVAHIAWRRSQWVSAKTSSKQLANRGNSSPYFLKASFAEGLACFIGHDAKLECHVNDAVQAVRETAKT